MAKVYGVPDIIDQPIVVATELVGTIGKKDMVAPVLTANGANIVPVDLSADELLAEQKDLPSHSADLRHALGDLFHQVERVSEATAYGNQTQAASMLVLGNIVFKIASVENVDTGSERITAANPPSGLWRPTRLLY